MLTLCLFKPATNVSLNFLNKTITIIRILTILLHYTEHIWGRKKNLNRSSDESKRICCTFEISVEYAVYQLEVISIFNE